MRAEGVDEVVCELRIARAQRLEGNDAVEGMWQLFLEVCSRDKRHASA